MNDIKSNLFGQLAVRAGLVTQDQVDDCLTLQERYRQSGKAVPKLGEILASKEYLSPEQVKAILQGKFGGPGRRFGEICVQMQFASLEQVKECLEEQRRLEKEGQAPRVGMILAKRGYMRPHQITAVLEAQGVEVVWCPECDLHYNIAAGAPIETRRCSTCHGELVTPEGPPPIDFADDEVEEAEETEEAGDFEELEEDEDLEEITIAETLPPGTGPVGETKMMAAVGRDDGAGAAPVRAVPVDEAEEVVPAAPARPPAERLTEIGGYRITSKIGVDAQGILCKAEHIDKGTVVALRVIDETRTRDPEFYRVFAEQAKRAAALRHANVKRIISAGRDKGHLYYASEFVDGKSLRKILESDARVSAKVAVRITRAVAEALRHGHSQGIIHGEIKPSHILVTPDGTVKLADFGLYRDPMANIELLTRSYGVTPFYLAPEQAMTEPRADSRTDIYSLGAVLYHMVTGSPPYSGNSSLEVMMRLTEEDLTPPHAANSSVEMRLSEMITKMMAAEPRERYQSVEALIGDLDALLAPPAPAPVRAPVEVIPMPAAVPVGTSALERKTEALSYPVEEAVPEGFSAPTERDIRQMVRAQMPEPLPVKPRAPKRRKRRAKGGSGGRRSRRDDDDDYSRRGRSGSRPRGRRDDYDDEEDYDRGRAPARRGDNTATIGLVIALVFIVAAAVIILMIMQNRESLLRRDDRKPIGGSRDAIREARDAGAAAAPAEEEPPKEDAPRSLMDTIRHGGD